MLSVSALLVDIDPLHGVLAVYVPRALFIVPVLTAYNPALDTIPGFSF